MKRIKSACLEQTIHFILKDGIGSAKAKKEVQQEMKNIKYSWTIIERSIR
ncbi:hypothetical protein [Robinsoniella peoriensis]